MKDHIDETLREWRSKPFRWGERDCLLSVADYVASRTGEDWGNVFRGTYDDERGARAHIEEYGGEKSLIDRSGLPWTGKPQRGDILLIDFAGKVLAGLCTGEGAAVRLEIGVKEIELRFVKILCGWKVP